MIVIMLSLIVTVMFIPFVHGVNSKIEVKSQNNMNNDDINNQLYLFVVKMLFWDNSRS